MSKNYDNDTDNNFYNTPVGKLTGFIALQQPSTKYDVNGIYKCEMMFSGKAAKEMKEFIDNFMEISVQIAAKNKGYNGKIADPPYKIKDKNLIVSFKQKARIETKKGDIFEVGIDIFDSKLNQIKEDIQIGDGTTAIINFRPYYWAPAALGAGCTLQVKKVQILNLVKREPVNPFEVLDSGFSIEDGEDYGDWVSEENKEHKFAKANSEINPFEDESNDSDDGCGDF